MRSAQRIVGVARADDDRRRPAASAPPRGARRRPPRCVVAGLTLAADDPFGTSLSAIDLTVRRRRDRRHRRRLRQRPAGAAGGALRRAPLAARDTVRHRSARPPGGSTPPQRRALGFAFVPEERLGRGAVPEMSLADNALLTAHRQRPGAARLRPMRDGARLRARATITDVRRQGRRARRRCAQPVGRQPAEVHRRPRDPASAEGADRRAADVGRGRRRGGADPPGADRPARRRRGGAGGLRGAGRAVRDLRPARGDRPGPAVAAEPVARDQRRGNRRADGGRSAPQPRARRLAAADAVGSKRAPRRRAPRLAVAAARGRRDAGLRLRAVLARSARIRWPAFHAFFIEPVATLYGVGELLLKATPLMLIARRARDRLSRQRVEHRRRRPADDGRDRRRRPGAAVPTTRVARCCCRRCSSPARAGGMRWAAIPACLRTRFNANEILTSLMLVYVATLCCPSWCTGRGAIPKASTFRSRRLFARAGAAAAPAVDDTRLNCGIRCWRSPSSRWAWLFMRRSLAGFQMRVAGLAPAAARLRRHFRTPHGMAGHARSAAPAPGSRA